MIPIVLGAVFVAACLIGLATYLLHGTVWAGIAAVRVFMMFGHIVLMVLVTVFGSLAWMIWFCVAPKHAMASLRKAQAEHKGAARG